MSKICFIQLLLVLGANGYNLGRSYGGWQDEPQVGAYGRSNQWGEEMPTYRDHRFETPTSSQMNQNGGANVFGSGLKSFKKIQTLQCVVLDPSQINLAAGPSIMVNMPEKGMMEIKDGSGSAKEMMMMEIVDEEGAKKMMDAVMTKTPMMVEVMKPEEKDEKMVEKMEEMLARMEKMTVAKTSGMDMLGSEPSGAVMSMEGERISTAKIENEKMVMVIEAMMAVMKQMLAEKIEADKKETDSSSQMNMDDVEAMMEVVKKMMAEKKGAQSKTSMNMGIQGLMATMKRQLNSEKMTSERKSPMKTMTDGMGRQMMVNKMVTNNNKPKEVMMDENKEAMAKVSQMMMMKPTMQMESQNGRNAADVVPMGSMTGGSGEATEVKPLAMEERSEKRVDNNLEMNGDVDNGHFVNYKIYQKDDKASAKWEVNQGSNGFNYNLEQDHPDGGWSSVKYYNNY